MNLGKVEGVIISLNEERGIERALRSLSWCSRILVLDSGSSDRTLEIARLTAKELGLSIEIHSTDWPGFSEQRNRALSLVQADWAFFLDADEECSASLGQKIVEIADSSQFPGNSTAPYYLVRRREYFIGKEIRHGAWNPSYHPRLIRKGSGKFDKPLHEGFDSDQGMPGRIEAPIEHWIQRSIEDILDRVQKYTSIEAKRDFDSGIRINLIQTVLVFPAMFFKAFIYFGGWKDGRYGFAISVLEGVARVVRCLKLWQIQEQKQVPGAPWYRLWRGHPS